MAGYCTGFYVKRKKLTDREFRIMAVLADSASAEDGLAEVSVSYLEEKTGKKGATLRRIIDALEDRGELVVYSNMGRPSRKVPEAGKQYQRTNVFRLVAFCQHHSVPEPEGPEWDAAKDRRTEEKAQGRETGTPARNRAGVEGDPDPRAESRAVDPRAESRADPIKNTKNTIRPSNEGLGQDPTADVDKGTSKTHFAFPSPVRRSSKDQSPRGDSSMSNDSPSGDAAKDARDAIFWAWRDHLEERWGYKLDSAAYGEERSAAGNLAKRGYTADQVLEVYDACKDDWEVSGHMRLNAIVRHMDARLNGVKGGRQANGRRKSAAEADRGVVTGVPMDQAEINEILAAFQ